MNSLLKKLLFVEPSPFVAPRTAHCFLLMLGDDGALLVPPMARPFFSQNRGAAEPFFFPGNAPDERLLSLLRRHKKTPVLVVADTLAQDFRRELLPPLSFFDKRRLAKRRLLSAFPVRALSALCPLSSREILLAGLHRTQSLERWLDALGREENPSGLIALAPLESARALTRLDHEAKRGWAMLLTWQRTGGFRQIVTKDGALILTRLTPPPAQGTSPIFTAASLAIDLEASRDYLARLGLHEKTPLIIHACLPTNLHEPLVAAMSAQSATEIRTLTPFDAAQRMGLSFGPVRDDPFGDLLHAAWLIDQKRPQTLLARPEDRQLLRARLTHQIAAFCFWTFLTLGVGANGFFGFQIFKTNAETRTALSALATQTDKMKAERAQSNAREDPLQNLRAAALRQRLFKSKDEPLQTLWHALAGALEQDRLVRLDGQLSESDELWHLSVLPAQKSAASAFERQALNEHMTHLGARLAETLPGFEVKLTSLPFTAPGSEADSAPKTQDDLLINEAALALPASALGTKETPSVAPAFFVSSPPALFEVRRTTP